MAAHLKTEAELVTLLQQGDRQAIEHIYSMYAANLLGVIYNIVKDEAIAEDVLQESFVKIWKYSRQYDASKGRLFTWLINICRNSAIDKVRSKTYKQRSNIQNKDKLVSEAESIGQTGFNPDQMDVRDWVHKLPPEYVEAIDIVYFQGYTHIEAAENLGIPLGTLKSRVRKALMSLRKWV